MLKKILIFGIFFIDQSNAFFAHFSYRDDVLDLIREAGYRGEAHQVEVPDGGWILKMHRIPPRNIRGVKPIPVFLMHGIFAASADYVVTGNKKALAYLLADNNYDVWMGNSRGNRHASVNYRTTNPNSLWDFSYHEIGKFDLKAMIDYVLAYTNTQKLFYVGHSQGTTALLVLLSTRPEYNAKIVQAHLLAPVSYQKYLPHPLIKAIARPLYDGFEKTGQTILDLGSVFGLASPITKVICNETINYHKTQLCKGIIYAIVGQNLYGDEIDSNILPDIVNHISWKISVKQLKHYAQGFFYGHFKEFDYGQTLNLRFYNSTEPPDYNLRNIQVPIYLYRGPQDLITSKWDIERLASQLPNLRHFSVIPNYNHLDFTFGRRSRKVLYYDILKSFESEIGYQGRSYIY